MIHRLNVFFLSITLVLSQIFIINSANAATVGGWSLSNPIAKGASTVYTGIKNVTINGADYVKKGTAIVTPTATGVAKVLARGVAGYALSIAVEQILGAVDWVLDPANNRIVYFTDAKFDGYLVRLHVDPYWNSDSYYRDNMDAVVADFYNYYANMNATMNPLWAKFVYTGAKVVKLAEGSYELRHDGYLKNPDGTTYNDCKQTSKGYCVAALTSKPHETEARTEKYLPLDVVAQKVIDNAESNSDQNKKAASQTATQAAAADMVEDATKDDTKARPIAQQLEASAKTIPADEAVAEKANEATGEQTKNPDKPDTTDLKLTFPIFCDWATTVCEAAQTVISFPTTLTDWWTTGKEKAEGWATSISEAWTEVKDWVKPEQPAEQETKVDIQESVSPPTENNYLQWNAYCPFTAKSDEISINGENSSLSSDLTSWCTMASEIKPFVLLAGALAALMIVSGVGLGRSED